MKIQVTPILCVASQVLYGGQEDPLEEGMAIHSSILTWKIPWTEDLGRLQSTGSHSWTQQK